MYFLLFIAFLLSNCDGYDAIENGVFISNLASTKIDSVRVTDELEKTICPSLAEAISEDVVVSLTVDEDYMATYNHNQNKSYIMLPDSLYEISVNSVVIKAGDMVSEELFNILIKSVANIADFGDYVLPLSISSEGGSVTTIGGYDKLLLHISSPLVINYPRFGSTPKTFYEFAKEDGIGFITGGALTVEYNVAHSEFNKAFGQTGDPLWYTPWLKYYCTFGDKDRYPYNLRLGVYGDTYKGDFVFNDNEWYHIAIVNTTYDAKLYINGELEATLTTDREVLVETFKIYLNGAKLGANGLRALSEYRIWNTERTQQELVDNRWSVPVDTEGLQFYWKMNEGEGTILHESAHKHSHEENGENIYYDLQAECDVNWALKKTPTEDKPF